MGKLASYAAVRRRHPEPPATDPVLVVDSTATPATEKVDGVISATLATTEQVVGVVATTLGATEQATDVSGAAVLTQRVVVNVSDDGVANFEEEMKTEDEPGLDAFDRHVFMEAFRAENLFGPGDVDDVNLSDKSFLCSAYAESDEESSAFSEYEGEEEDDYVDEVEADPEFVDVSLGFQQDDAEMRERASSGWELYDQDHCAELKLDGAALYDGLLNPPLLLLSR